MKQKLIFIRPIVLLFGVILLVISCQQDDDEKPPNNLSVEKKSSTKTISGKDVPHVLNFIRFKSNHDMGFILDDSNSPEGQFRNHEENLSLTITLTDEIKQVTDSYGKSNYTFKLIEEEAKEGVYFLNLVVKEYRDTFYLYIVKYVADNSWIASNSIYKDFDDFTGTIYYYSDQGIYIAKMDMASGVSTSINKNPCNDDNDNSDDNSGGSGSGNGGAGNSGDGNATGDSGTDSGSGTGNNGSGWEGCTSYVDYEELDCNCGCGSCPVVAVILWDCGGGPNYGAEESNNTFYNFLRNPCDDIEDDCPAEIDCEFGWDDNCQCLDEPDENDEVGVIVPNPFIQNCNELQELLDNPDIKAQIQELQQNSVVNNDDYNKEKGFNLQDDGGNLVPDGITEGQGNGFKYSTFTNTYGGVHSHSKSQYPMFSVDDILNLYGFLSNLYGSIDNLPDSLPVHVLVTNQGVYALKVNDAPNLILFYSSFLNGFKDLKKQQRLLNRQYDKFFDETTNQQGNSLEHQLAFLRYTQGNLGISLYKANDDLTNWTKQEITNDNLDINSTNCAE